MSKFINNLAYEVIAESTKTFMIIILYLPLLFKGAEPSRILAEVYADDIMEEVLSDG